MSHILVTGAAGFIGFHLCKKFSEDGFNVVGIDNINNYYDVNLKYARLKELGICREKAEEYHAEITTDQYPSFKFIRMNLEDRDHLPKVFQRYNFSKVCNMAAQAGVRYSLENPQVYIDSNIVGFSNLLECCRNYNVKHLIYASSSSVYGKNTNVPFTTKDNVDEPVSLYAATKKSNELMAYTYSHLYDMKVTGLRFFTVYGPWGRPDMAMFLFTDAIINGHSVNVFNNGDMERDFTYIKDIVEGVYRITVEKNNDITYSLYNIGNNKPVKLLDFIEEIEKQLGVKAKKKMLPMQPGDVYKTWADCSDLKRDYNYNPQTSINTGIKKFIEWYKSYYEQYNSI